MRTKSSIKTAWRRSAMTDESLKMFARRIAHLSGGARRFIAREWLQSKGCLL